ncbi:ABC transporter ATP-binding protein [Corynebacterium suranareeae]|uniref:Fatty acid ABC transporter ATP-binding/permease protein n=1 Tax=Corynebacterium suranareeae TaxID=2506452 RepID=A0A160PSH4_9CORY|nr:ABC transporter ATP-binding protein [Corynebacterium suranareeae]BAU96625.1 ABC transporter ATP-binding protein [Corynebacterium suranareeae]
MRLLGRILKTTSALWPYYLGIIVVSIVIAALSLLSPFILREATDSIVAAVTGTNTVDAVTRTIIFLSLALFAASLLNTVMTNIGGYIGDVMASRMRQILSTRYYAKLLALPQKYFDNQVTGTIIARLDRSINGITQFMQSFSNNFFPMLITMVAVLIISAIYYWPLAILLAMLFPIYMWLTALTSKRWQKYEGEKNHEIDVANGRFAEVVGQVKVVKSFVAETRELADFGGRYGKTVAITRPQSGWWHRMDTLRGAALNIIFLAIHLLIFYRTLHGHFSIGDMVMLIQLVTMAQQPVYMMSYIVDSAQRAIAGSRDYFEVMAQPVEPTANKLLVDATLSSNTPRLQVESPDALPAGEPAMEFSNVSFAYEEGKPVISDVSITARHGERIALVGESGGGKSTLVNLLLGLYKPDSGNLSVCGVDVADLTSEQLRASVGVVFQDASLFSGSIAENIAYGRPDATREEIIAVAKKANAHEFISAFPDGYDTVVGERGLKLSGGQKQRVSVARAMLKDAPLLVLDEATSALDTKSEQAVQAGLEQLMENRTTLMIAHRLSTIAGVDTIVTIHNGRVEEVGSPAELAVSGGIYSELLRLTNSTAEADRKRLRAFGFTGDAPVEDEEL